MLDGAEAFFLICARNTSLSVEACECLFRCRHKGIAATRVLKTQGDWQKRHSFKSRASMESSSRRWTNSCLGSRNLDGSVSDADSIVSKQPEAQIALEFRLRSSGAQQEGRVLAVNSLDEAGPPSLGCGLEGSAAVTPSVSDTKKRCSGMPGNRLTPAGSSSSIGRGRKCRCGATVMTLMMSRLLESRAFRPFPKPGLKHMHTQAPTSSAVPAPEDPVSQPSPSAADSITRPSGGNSPRWEPHPFLATENAHAHAKDPRMEGHFVTFEDDDFQKGSQVAGVPPRRLQGTTSSVRSTQASGNQLECENIVAQEQNCCQAEAFVKGLETAQRQETARIVQGCCR